MKCGSYYLQVTILLFWSVKLILISKGNAALNPEEENALEVLRMAINLPNWTTSDPCNETWIECSNSSVISLALKWKNLTGTIPPDISKLRNARVMDLNGNYLNGSVPKSLENMTQATYINLRTNMFVGPLPNLSVLVNLEQFDGSNNGFNGPLPDIKNLEKLFGLSVAHNFLSGPIPPSVFAHSQLNWLYISNNSWDAGPIPDMSQLSVLGTLDARLCNFQGAIPSLGNNVLLRKLLIQLNNLTSIPSDLRNLTSLEIIDVNGNIISGKLPELPSNNAQPLYKLRKIDFSNNSFIGEIPASWEYLAFLQDMQLGNNKLTGSIPKEFGNLRSLEKLNLSYNFFSGPIPDEMIFLVDLQTLDLRNNQLSGIVPEWLINLSHLQSLYLDNNNFTGIPWALATKEGLNISSGNLKIISLSSPGPALSSGGIVGIVVGALCAGILLMMLLFIRRRRKYKYQLFREDMPKSIQAFGLKQIKAMTQNFKTLIGKGGFGPVYYGILPNGKEIAVKVKAMDSKQGANEFLNEVRLLSRLHHRNLVPLVGYCVEAQEQILVYTYMSQGSLYAHLHHLSGSSSSQGQAPGSSTYTPLDWKTRIDIAVNSARGLEYLHKDCNPPVIHRDVKSSNILLTDKLEAKFGDLGISKQAPEDTDAEGELNMTGITTAIKGTFGYLDPEYVTRQRLTTKSDVYSFGMILLEIITGKRAQSQKFPDSDATSLKEWVEGAVGVNNLRSIVDPVLNGEYNEEGMLIVVRIALSCLRPTGAERPEMGEVVRTLIETFPMEKKIDMESSLEVYDEITVPLSGQLNVPYNEDSHYLSSFSTRAIMEHPSWNTDPR